MSRICNVFAKNCRICLGSANTLRKVVAVADETIRHFSA